MASQQWERVAAEGEAWTPIFALTYLGRNEEASLLAFERAEKRADVGSLLRSITRLGTRRFSTERHRLPGVHRQSRRYGKRPTP